MLSTIGQELKSTLLKCSETSRYENTNTDHRHGTEELGRVRTEGGGSRQSFSEGPGLAHHSLCPERFRTGQLGGTGLWAQWGSLGSKGWSVPTPRPAPKLVEVCASDPLADTRAFLDMQLGPQRPELCSGRVALVLQGR